MGIKINEEFYQNGFNPYKKLTPVQQTNVRNASYLDIFENFFTEIWELNGLPEDFDIPTYFKLKLYFGRVGWFKDSLGVYVGLVEEIGTKLNRYGHLNDCSISFKNGEFFEGERDKDIIIGYLNKMHTCEPNFRRFADILSEVDLSLKVNIDKTRLAPIPIFQDQKIKDAIEKGYEAIKKGEQGFYIYDSTLKSVLSQEMGNGQRFDLLNLTDPKSVDQLDSLSQFHDDLISRLCILYGINMVRDTKKAQVNNEELKGYCDLARINILNMLEEFEKELDKVNTNFGTNITVKLSKPWAWVLEEDTNEEPEEEPSKEKKEGEDNEPIEEV